MSAPRGQAGPAPPDAAAHDPSAAHDRSAVHAASPNPLGAARPRQEGPTDLRLVPPALGAWATAALTLDASPRTTAGVVVVCLVVAGALLVAGRSRRGGQGRRDGGRRAL
ncbi:hypothetical protein FE633_43000, partial [Streptomyces montanus]